MTLYDLYIRKTGSESTKSLVADFGLRLTSCPMLIPTEVKDAYVVDFKDEDGVESYNEQTLRFKPFDATFKVVSITDSTSGSHGVIQDFLDYMTTNGALHDIYSAWAHIGRQKCRFKGVSDISQHMNGSSEFVLEFSFTLSVEDPITEMYESDF